MSVIRTINIETKEGNEYVLQFLEFELDFLTEQFPIKIIDISLIAEVNKEVNSPNSLYVIADHVKKFSQDEDCIFYYYCDFKELDRRDKTLLPQEYRFKLFNILADRKLGDEFVKESIIIEDETNDRHFITLIAFKKHQKYMEEVVKYISDLNK